MTIRNGVVMGWTGLDLPDLDWLVGEEAKEEEEEDTDDSA